MKPLSAPIKKTTALGLLFLGLTLPACSASWLVDPLTRYLQKKTGLEIRIQEADWEFRSFRLVCKKIEVGRRDPALQVRLFLDRLAVQFGWEWAGQPPFWPRIHIERLEAERPRGEIRIRGGETRTDWRNWFRKMPAVRVLEIHRFSGEIEAADNVFHFSSGVDLSGSILPQTGARLRVKSGPLQGGVGRGVSLAAGGIGGEAEIIPEAHSVSWKARVDLAPMEIRTPRFRISGAAGSCSARGRKNVLEVSHLEGRLSGFQGIIRGFRVQGQGALRFRGSALWDLGGQQEIVIPSLTLTLDESRIVLEKGQERLKGLASGELRCEGALPRPRLSGKVQVTGVQGELPPVRLTDFRGVIPVKGTYPELAFTGVEVRAAEFVWQSPASPLSLTQAQADFSARILDSGRHLSVEGIRLSSREWGRLAGGLEFDRRTGAIPNGRADLAGFPLENLINLFPAGDLPIKNLRIPVQGRVVWQRGAVSAPWEFRMDLATLGLTRPWAEGRWGVEDLDTRFRARLTWDAGQGDWSGEGSQYLDRGSLVGNWRKIRFNAHPLEMEWKGRFKADEKNRILEGQARLSFVPSGPGEVSGRLSWDKDDLHYEARLTAAKLPLDFVYFYWRNPPGSEPNARVRETDLRGNVAMDLTLAGNKRGGRLLGRLDGADLRAAGADSSWVLGLKKLDLPLHWAYGDRAYPECEEARIGALEVEEIKTAWTHIRNLEIPVRAKKNRFEIPGAFAWPFGGGHLFLENPVLTLDGELPVLETGLILQGLDLSVLLPAGPVAGSVQGDLGRIRLDPRKGEAPGSLRAAVFDGWVEARDLALLDPFGPERRLQANVAFDYINLEKVTGLFSFGRISGYVQGRVDGLVMKNLAPERFELTLKTREVEGVAKRINIKAVENVSLLGTGFGEPGGLQRGINRWFQDYAYREIGLSCRLAGDTFTLRGTIFEGGTEYLVKSPGLYGIDVINQNPENEISFSDMLERLERIREKKDPGGSHDDQ